MSKNVPANKSIKIENLPLQDQLKYEIAEELGLLDKVREQGWKSLTAKETGRIGGLMTKKKKQLEQQKNK
ncbi:MAG: small, acid-soluble spore protein, alpha/beta type [Epulopiscium sp.]|nr:small, acid-soluble spore protein, alpha/beta type [Candidatus Epulonipiscium sp.]